MKATVIALIFIIVFSSSLYANEILKPEPHEFTAKVSSVRLNTQLISQGKNQDDHVSVHVSSIILNKPLQITDVRNAKPHSLSEINTIISYTKANTEGSAEDILSYWSPGERAEKSKLLSDPKIFNKNREYHQKHPGLVVIGLIFQADTTSVLVERHGSVLGVTLREGGGKYYLTDNPSNDLELAIIEASFANE